MARGLPMVAAPGRPQRLWPWWEPPPGSVGRHGVGQIVPAHADGENGDDHWGWGGRLSPPGEGGGRGEWTVVRGRGT